MNANILLLLPVCLMSCGFEKTPSIKTLKDAIRTSGSVEYIEIYPTKVSTEGYNLVNKNIVFTNPDVVKDLFSSITASERYFPSHPSSVKSYRINMKVGDEMYMFRASLLTEGITLIWYDRFSFSSENLTYKINSYILKQK